MVRSIFHHNCHHIIRRPVLIKPFSTQGLCPRASILLQEWFLNHLVNLVLEEWHFSVVLRSGCWNKRKPTRLCGPTASNTCQALAHRGLSTRSRRPDRDGSHCSSGVLKPGKRGRGAAAKRQVVVAMEVGLKKSGLLPCGCCSGSATSASGVLWFGSAW